MVEQKKRKYLCGTEPWVSADITEAEYREWLRGVYSMRVVKVVENKGNSLEEEGGKDNEGSEEA